MKIDTEFPNAREGVFVPPGFATPDQIVEVVQFAEDLGYNALWATDFITPTPMYGIPPGEKPDWYEPLISIAYCAAFTKKIKLGTGLILITHDLVEHDMGFAVRHAPRRRFPQGNMEQVCHLFGQFSMCRPTKNPQWVV